MPFKKPILSDFGVCARYLPMQSALQQVFGSYDKRRLGFSSVLSWNLQAQSTSITNI